MKHEHSFAKAWLFRFGHRLLINNQEFLAENVEEVLKQFEIRPLMTYITVGQQLLDNEEIQEITIMSYEDMRRKYNLTVYRLPVDAARRPPWRVSQRYVYVIGPRKPGIPDEVPVKTFRNRGFKLEWNRADRCVRGVGEGFGTVNGIYGIGNITPWYKYEEPTKGRATNLQVLVRHKSYSEISGSLYSLWEGKKPEKTIKKYIKEQVPFMITEEGLLLCMPKSNVLPVILIVGKRGKGKSFCLNSLLGRIFYCFQDRIGLLNDSLNQFYDLMLPTNEAQFIRELSRVGNEPRPLPVINLYMSCPGVKIKYADENVGYRLVVPFKDFLRGWKYWTYGVGRWDLGKAERYMTNEVIDGIKNIENVNDIKTALYSLLPNANDEKEGKNTRAMIFKWTSTFENILRDEFTSNLFKKEAMTAPYWVFQKADQKFYGHPFIVAMEAGLVPVVNNHMAKSFPIAKKQMVDLMYKVVRHQMEMDEKKNRIWICIDELRDFLDKKNDELYKGLDYLFTQGRFNKIGFIGNIQEYTKLTQAMRNNASHLFVFELQAAQERMAVAKDFNLDHERLEEMANLKTFQCLFTTKEKIIVYDKDGRAKEVQGGVWRGRVLPPITCHKSP